MARQRQQIEYVGNNMFKLARLGLKLFGMRPPMKQCSKEKQTFYKWYSLILHYNFAITAIQCLLLLFKELVLDKNILKALGHMHISLATILICVKGIYCRRKDLLALFQNSIEWANNNSKGYNTAASFEIKYCKILNMAIITSTFVALLAFVYMNILAIKKTTTTVSEEFPWVFWYGFDAGKYEIYLFWSELVRLIIIALLNISTQIILITFVTDCIAKCKVLQYKFANFHVAGKQGIPLNHRAANDRLKILVKEHQQIIDYITKLNKILKNLLYVEYNVSSIMIACFLIQILEEQHVTFNIVALCLLSSQLLLLCFNANEVGVQTSRISRAMYDSSWYQYGKEIGLSTQIIMTRSSRPLYFTIGPFGPLTANSGVEVLKLAYTFISVLSGRNE